MNNCNSNWRTNLGGAVSVTGTGLIGIGMLSQLTQLSPASQVLSPHQLAIMWYVALTGFMMSCLGKGLTALFAADAKSLANAHDEILNIKQALQSGGTDIFRQPAPPPAPEFPTNTANTNPTK